MRPDTARALCSRLGSFCRFDATSPLVGRGMPRPYYPRCPWGSFCQNPARRVRLANLSSVPILARVRFANLTRPPLRRGEACLAPTIGGAPLFCQNQRVGFVWPKRSALGNCAVLQYFVATLQISRLIARQFTRSTLDRLRRISVRKHQLQGRIPKNSDRILSHKGGTRPMLEHQPNP